jgi:acyl-coenzyme A thioesterase PaaI-like protein
MADEAEGAPASAPESAASFAYRPDPDRPGWNLWSAEVACFNRLFAPMRVRPLGEKRAECRLEPPEALRNVAGHVHGGALAAIADMAVFAGLRAMGHEDAGAGVTLGLDCQFLAPGSMDRELDIDIELLRATGRLFFLRGLIAQQGKPLFAFSATARRPGRT